jgi:hypothetical protein
MAAQGGIRYKILRLSMPFEKGRNTTRKPRVDLPRRRLLFGSAKNAWSTVLKVQIWVRQLRERKVASCAEIAWKEGITRARVSQLWQLGKITRELMDNALKASRGKEVSLRRLIQLARNPEVE